MPEQIRSLVLWVPDWPVVAVRRERAKPSAPESTPGTTGGDSAAGDSAAGDSAARDDASGDGRTTPDPDPEPDPALLLEAEPPLAVIEKNLVVACSATARAEGVRRGQRRRDAQGHCPRLELVPADAARDHRAFSPLVSAVEQLAPHVQVVRPGLCALKARGPARYYGGESAAAETLRAALVAQGIVDVRVGIADGPFTAEQAARAATRADDPIRIVPPGRAGDFLAPLPVTALLDSASGGQGETDLAHLLARLGVHTLGAFAGLEVDRVRERLGERGVHLQSLAAGADSRTVEPRTPPPELHREVVFDPPVELAEQAAFGMRVAAEEFIARLDAERLVCTELRVELWGDRGERSERVWLHPGTFDGSAVVDRVRWQLAEEQEFRSGVTRVRISPEAVDAAAHHVVGLFGAGEREKVHHALSRVQAILGHRGVVTPVVGGGRWLEERQVLVPWGDRATTPGDPSRPWPGSLPAPLPTTVYPRPRPAEVRDGWGQRVTVDERGMLSAAPVDVAVEGARRAVVSWAGPWPVVEREWDAVRRRVAHRFQIVDAAQEAWLLVHEADGWHAEAKYD
ncbi:DNA polymerase Y family protein [Microbacterium caowuchunii]|uniref:DNA polymerase Y family protein n=1 Tax=Microbacterium caowuchunii TaxID=2614638 RepID=A0A5N0T842_9MICO|nr:DNA polymerase Y family protein [Microbacterium caowuchunii]KAA9131090.1 DNA polymerase Y family protein [Microbacterium caowuchunii]